MFLTRVQIVNFNTWDRYYYWFTHVTAAGTLLELRGRDQFARDRGAQLYIQSRSQIVGDAVKACPSQKPAGLTSPLAPSLHAAICRCAEGAC